MKLKISPQILHDFPGATIGVVVAYGSKNAQDNKEVQALLKDVQEKVRQTLKLEGLADHPHMSTWTNAYKKFGANPKKYPPSVLNLTLRVLKKPLNPINSFVDLYNVISLKYLLPAGGEDLDTIKGDLELTKATSNELPIVLLGDSQAAAPEEGEVLYKDANGAICRRWNWKEADRSKLTPSTQNAIFVLELLPPVEQSILESATHELAQLIQQYCQGKVSVAILNAAHPEITIKKDGNFVDHHKFDQRKINTFEVYNKEVVVLEEMAEHEKVSHEHKARLDKVEKMKAAGIDPWPAGKPVNVTCHQVIEEFKDEQESREYHLEGRVMTLRGHGKTVFAHIQDRSGKLQVYIKQDVLGDEKFNWFNQFVDIGDFIWVKGHSFKTKTGEITLKVSDFALQSKCLYPLPDKFHGLSDIEVRYRQRYLDLISSPENRERFVKRSLIVRTMRNFLDAHEYIEVETPMLHPIPGGAAARPFITHHNTLDSDFYLRIAPELYLKRLVVGGFERVYEINRNFRNEGISTRHNPEFTMLEFYTAYQDYHWVMNLVEEMLRDIANKVCQTTQLQYGNHHLDFSKPFERISMKDAVIKYGDLAKNALEGNAIDAVIKQHNIETANKNASWGEKLVALFDKLVEPHLIQPTFIIEYPIEISPLSKRDANNPNIAARFELFVAGMELSNGFNELNDPFDQAQRFREQADARTSGDTEAHHYDADYVHALEYGLPPTVGVGIGIDRLTMLLTNTTSIKDVILFPTLKKKHE
jgi:lysyl-tRNA synthetase class 2